MSNNPTSENLDDILSKSSLSESDRSFWSDNAKNMPKERVDLLAAIFTDNPSLLAPATEILKEKINAKDDPGKLKEVLRKEKELLKQSLE